METLRNSRKSLSLSKKLFIGGCGALIPIALSFLSVDAKTLLAGIGPGVMLGVGLKVVVLFGLGATMAFLNQDEKKPTRLFQLGMSAPALLAAWINVGADVNSKKMVFDFSLISTAEAQSLQQISEIQVSGITFPIKEFKRPEIGFKDQVYSGVFGKLPDIFYVIAGTSTDASSLAESAARVNDLIQQAKNQNSDQAVRYRNLVKLSIYREKEVPNACTIVLAENLNSEDAKAVERWMIESGVAGAHVYRLN